MNKRRYSKHTQKWTEKPETDQLSFPWQFPTQYKKKQSLCCLYRKGPTWQPQPISWHVLQFCSTRKSSIDAGDLGKDCSYLLEGDCKDRGDSVLNCRSTTLERRRRFLSCSSSFPGQFSSTGVPQALRGCRIVPGDTKTLSEELFPWQPAEWGVEELMMARKGEEQVLRFTLSLSGHQILFNKTAMGLLSPKHVPSNILLAT